MSDWSINIVSEDSLLLEWELNNSQPATPELTAKIRGVSNFLLEFYHQEIINVTPAYRSILIQFDILTANHQQMSRFIEDSINQSFDVDVSTGVLHQIPVLYDPSVAADLATVCNDKGLSILELIELHTSVIYDVYAVGFLPGFAYLGYVPEQLRLARHSSYRGDVPAGSVAIADRQTAIYPAKSPGGWQVIGRTQKRLLEKSQSVLQVGDRVQFLSVNQNEFLALGSDCDSC